MKICLISENYKPNLGGQYSALNNTIKICKYNNIKYTVIYKNSFAYKNSKVLNKIITDSDILHIFGGWTIFYFRIFYLSKKFKKKTIIHTMGLFDPQSLNQKKIKKKIIWHIYQKYILSSADLIHCGSKMEEKNLKLLNKSFKTIILPFCVENKNIKKTYSKKIFWKCIFFSRLHNQKVLDKLIKVWIILNNRNWNLDIFGFGNSESYINKFKIKKNHNIKFYKPIINEKKKYLNLDKYDFLVLPSLGESFGLAILEALARRIPVLTTDKTPWMDIRRYNSGWIIKNSILELKKVLNDIFNMPKNEILKKKKNTIKVVKKFNLEKVSKLYLNAYKKIK